PRETSAMSHRTIGRLVAIALALAATCGAALPRLSGQCQFDWLPSSGVVPTVGGDIYALAVYDGTLVAGGWFQYAGDNPAHNIAQWNGNRWQPMGSGFNGYVNALAVYEGHLIAG